MHHFMKENCDGIFTPYAVSEQINPNFLSSHVILVGSPN